MSQIPTPATSSESAAVTPAAPSRGALRRWSVAELLVGAVVRPPAARSQ